MKKYILLVVVTLVASLLCGCQMNQTTYNSGSSVEKLVKEYKEIIEEDYRYAFDNYTPPLNYYVQKNPGDYTMYGEYDADDLTSIEYIVNAAKEGKTEAEISLDLKNYIAENEGFLFWVDAVKTIDGRLIDTEVWFKYNAVSKTVTAEGGFYEPEWMNDSYKIYAQYEISEVPEWATEDERFVEAYTSYLDENGWSY